MKRHFFRILDFTAVLLVLASITAAFILVKNNKNSPQTLEISTPEGKFIYPLNKNSSITVKGKLGSSTIVIENGKAFFQDSPCPGKTCISMGKIFQYGEWASCLPNGIFMNITGTSEETDAVSQ